MFCCRFATEAQNFGIKKHRSAYSPCLGLAAGKGFAFGAQWSHPSHAANANFSRQAGASALPGRGNSHISPLRLEGSRRRIRLLSVHSHSHGGTMVSAFKRGARENPGAVFALVCGFAGVFGRVCRLHGAFFLPFSGFLSPESMFVPSYQNSSVFSSENPLQRADCAAVLRILRETSPRSQILGSEAAPAE